MKKLFFAAIVLFISAALSAQTLTIRFEGVNSSNGNPLYYAVDLDGSLYYSANAGNTENGRAKQLYIPNLTTGSHRIAVYQLADNTLIDRNTAQAEYNNTFQLRSGYDMVIAIRRNGQVSFSEKKATNTSTSTGTTISSAEFDKIYTSVKSNWSQTSKYNAVKTAFNKKTNYFTTEQAGQLVQLVTSEPRRLELAKLSYPRITDPENFVDMTDLFTSTTNRQNLERFYETKNPGVVTETYNNRVPMSDAEFSKLQTKVSLHFRQSSVVRDIKAALSNTTNYFTTGQIRSLMSMVSTEADKLAIAKLAYHRASDPNSFTQLYDLFSSQASVDNLNNYIRTTRS